ncbi:hypothetical protein ACT4UM_05085, partial [Bacillus sp. SS-TM]
MEMKLQAFQKDKSKNMLSLQEQLLQEAFQKRKDITLIPGLLVTAVSTSCFIPVSAYAKEGQTEVKTVYAQN